MLRTEGNPVAAGAGEVAADLLASATDQNLTSWRSGPAAAAVEHQTWRWL
jgi:glutamate/tyrosine decarboxylase-like PLP-dependent enzyme